MRDTLIINLLGGPGVGKSTTAAAVFAELKKAGLDCELVTEFAKDLVWEERAETFKDELYIFAKQAHRLFRVNGKVDVIITDRPLILTCYYAQKDKELSALCLQRFNSYRNLNFFLNRVVKYNPVGRNESEEEAIEVDKQTKAFLASHNIPFTEIPGDSLASDVIIKQLKEVLSHKWKPFTLGE